MKHSCSKASIFCSGQYFRVTWFVTLFHRARKAFLLDTSSHPPGVKRGFIKGEALRLLRTNSSKKVFEEKIKTFKSHLIERGYPENLIQATLSGVRFEERKLALQPKQRENKRILPFVTQYQPSVPNPKQILMRKWHFIEQQPLLSEIYKDPPLISYKRGRSLKDILVRATL